ncbi:MAG: TIGR00730 family Rossman fold protein [Bacteroidetes bacterium]|nr:TIGR00730 family Rossman fold protein [bacterium]NBP64520.1 TIGR00730 family Rossman fold protein [Bacteroidota bacterium]
MSIDIDNKSRILVSERAEEFYYLEGPKSRWREFVFTLKVMKEFISAFRRLHFVGPCITVFGSARYSADHEYYKLSEEIGKALVNIGFTVMTGGGPGIMEGANKGAFEENGISVGAEILLPHEQKANPFLHATAKFQYFFVRKFLLFKYSYGFIVLPGGFGTMDELFEALTLIQTKKIKDFPVVVMGTSYYQPLSHLFEHMAMEGTIDRADLELVLFTDSIQEAMSHIQQHSIERFKLKKKTRAFTYFGESSFTTDH